MFRNYNYVYLYLSTFEKLPQWNLILESFQRHTYKMLQTIQMKLILLCVWAEQAVLGSAKTALEFKYEI